MKSKVSQFSALIVLGVGLANVSTLLYKYFPALSELFHAITSFILLAIALTVVICGLSYYVTGSNEWMFKACAILAPPGGLVIFGILLGLTR